MITGNEPYYPQPIASKSNDQLEFCWIGITIRQKAILEFMSKNSASYGHHNGHLSKDAIEFADAYIKTINS